MYSLKMCQRTIILLLLVSSTYSQFFDFYKIKSYVKFFDIRDLYTNDTGNSLWQGILKDCSKKTSFSCIQKNVYTYLDDTFTDRENITVFDGFYMTKNDLDYHKYSAEYNENERENDVEEGGESKSDESGDGTKRTDDETPDIEDEFEEPLSPLEEVTNAIHGKAIEFLATRNYEVQLPSFFFEGATIKVSPKEVDEDGALIRVDFKQRDLSTQGRFFKKIKKFIQSKLVTSFLALLLIIKLIKIKFMFVIPFLFGVGTAKKLFLKLLLFLIPAFAHVFKLCSSYYSSGTKYHHHHHQIAHHHHHVPVPVPIPAYHDHHHPHHHESEDNFEGYDYAHPHIQYRKDVEELKEWGIEPYDDPGVVAYGPYAQVVDPSAGQYGMPQYAANARPVGLPNHLGPFEKYAPHNQMKYDKPPGPHDNPNPNIRHTLNNLGPTQLNKNRIGSKGGVANLGPIGNHAQNLAFNGYLDDVRLTRATPPVTESNLQKGHHQPFNPQTRPVNGFQKSVSFATKSDNVNAADNWFGDNALRGQQAIKSPVFVHATPTAQTYGQSLNAATQNLMKPFQHPSNALPNSQQAFQHPLALNPSASSVQKPVYNHQQQSQKQTNGVETLKQELTDVATNDQARRYDDDYYGPILGRLDEIFKQLRFAEEVCRERLICSMYKNPANYTPHSNLVSNELSREPEELRQGNKESVSGRRFQRYLNAARTGQDGGDCPRLYACYISSK